MDDVFSPRYLILGASVVAGMFIGRAGYEHFFVHGLEEPERKGLMIAAASGVILLGLYAIYGADSKVFQPEGFLERVMDQ